MKNKKAQIGSNINLLTFASVLFVVLVIIITVGAIVTTNLKENVDRDSNSVVNESDDTNLLWGNATNMTLNQDEVIVLSVYNCSVAGTTNVTIPTSNYTVYPTLGKIQCDTNSSALEDGTAICVNYTYLDHSVAYNVSEQGEEGLITFSDFFGVIAIVIILVVIVGLLLGVILMFRRKT